MLLIVIDVVDDAEPAHSDTPDRLESGEFDATGRPWIIHQISQSILDPLSIFR